MPKKLPMFYSTLMLTAVNLVLRLVSTAFQVFLSGRIGATGIGLLQLVLSVGGLAMTGGMAGIRTATMYLTAEELGKKQPGNVTWVLRSCCTYSLVCSGILSLGLQAEAPRIAEVWIGNPAVTPALRTLALFLPAVCLCGCMTGYFTAANRIMTLAAVEIAEQVCTMAVTVVALTVWAGHDPGKACAAVVLGSSAGACLTLICLLLLRFLERTPSAPRISVTPRLLDTAVPLALADDLKVGINTLENLMVPRRLSLYSGPVPPLAAFGTVCGMVFPVLMFPAAILYALAELLIPEMARCAAAGSRKRIQYLASRSLRLALLYGCFCGGIMQLLSAELGMGLYDSPEAGRHLALYAWLAPMLYCDAITDAMTKGLGQQKVCVRYNILTAALDVALLYLLLPEFGMLGYYFSFFVTHLLNFGLSLRLLLRTAKIRLPIRESALTLSAALAAIIAAAPVSGWAWRLGAFLAVFGSLLTLLGVVSREDLHWLQGLVKR